MEWKRLPAAVQLLGIGWYFAGCIVIGIFGGVILDSLFDTSPLFSMLGLFVGLATAAYGGYRMLVDFLRHQGTPHRPGDNE